MPFLAIILGPWGLQDRDQLEGAGSVRALFFLAGTWGLYCVYTHTASGPMRGGSIPFLSGWALARRIGLDVVQSGSEEALLISQA